MSAEYCVIGHFKYVDDAKKTIEAFRDRGFSLELYSPVPNHDLEDVLYKGKKRSPVRRFTLIGGLTGCLGAFLMTSWMSLDWPLRTSAKTILSYPAFVIIAYECTILFGAIFTILSMFHFARLPNIFRTPAFRPQFTDDTFGLAVRVSKNQVEALQEEFKEFGASKTEIQYVR